MFHQKPLLFLSALLATTQAAAIVERAALDQLCGETGTKICYGAPAGTSQNLDPDDVAYAAVYLRAYGQSLSPAGMLNMVPTKAPNCAEWSLYTIGTTMILGKHISPTLNSSVLFEDIANTIDGGDPSTNPTDAQVAASLLGCGKNGGSMNVTIDKTRPEYNTAAYKAAGNTPNGIIIKIVAAPKS